MYSIKQLFLQEPNAIREFVIAVLGVLVLTGVVDVSAEAVAGIGIVVSMGLSLLYVRQVSVSKDALKGLQKHANKPKKK